MACNMVGMRDISGLTYGKWTVLSFSRFQSRKNGSNISYWNCQCECGTLKEVRRESLTLGESKSCGCSHYILKEDLIDRRFGRLQVISHSGKEKGRHYWNCRCDCGEIKKVSRHSLIGGIVRSCGCLRRVGTKEDRKSTQLFTSPPLRRLYINYKSSALKRGHDFALEYDDFLKIVQENCYLCNSEPTQIVSTRYSYKGVIKRKSQTYNGIDRKDNTKGYTLENSKPCCAMCNRMKSEMTLDEFYTHLAKMTEYFRPDKD